MTANKLIEVFTDESMNYEEAGLELAIAMAQDGFTFKDAHCKLHHLKDLAKHAEKHLSKAAFEQLSKTNQPMNPMSLSKMAKRS